jgi:hypothetical protein
MSAADPLAGLVASLPEADGPAMSAILRLLDGAPVGSPNGARTVSAGESPAVVRLEHLRYKPGRSVVARVTGGAQPWWLVIRSGRSADKAAKDRARAAETGFPLIDADVPGYTGLRLQAGPLGLDRNLGKRLRRGELVDATGAVHGTVLSFNPWRRLVLRREIPGRTGPGGEAGPTTVLRLWDSAPASADLLAPLHAAGVAVRPARRTRAGLEQPWAPGGDLERLLAVAGSRHEAALALERAGEAVAGLHAALGRVPGLAEAGLSRVDPARALAAARDGVDAVMPDLLPAFDRVGKRVLRALAADRGPDVLLHGDLSADQAVLDGRGAVRLIDLDRLAIGPAGCDLGGFAAVELLLGRGAHAAEALVGAYGRRMGVDGMDEAASNAWTAYHLLLRLAEPFRALAPDYREQGAARIERACAVLTGGWGAGEWGADG